MRLAVGGLNPRFLDPMDAIPCSTYVAYVSILETSKIVPTPRYYGTFREIDAAFRVEQ